MTKYPRTLAALAGVERTVWSVVDALVTEVPVVAGRVPRGEWPKLMAAITDAGIVNPSSGDPYSQKWLEDLHRVGRWVGESSLERTYRNYPVRVVMGAKTKGRGDHAKALALLEETPKLHALAGTSPGGKVTAPQVIAGLEDEDVRHAVLSTTKGLSAVQRAAIDAHTMNPPRLDPDPLPPPSRFASAFWRAVQAVGIAHEQMEHYGVGTLDLDSNAHDAAKRMRRQANEVSAAVSEALVESTMKEA